MKTVYKRNIYAALSLFFLATIAVSSYYLMGGFDPIKVYQLEPKNRLVAGKYFVPGTYTNEAYEHGVMCKELIASGEMSGLLTDIVYLQDTLPGELGRFIGISLDEEVTEIPSGFEVRTFESKSPRFAVFMSMHVLVRPRPPKIEAMLLAKAQEDGYELRPLFFHMTYADNSATVEGWSVPLEE